MGAAADQTPTRRQTSAARINSLVDGRPGISEESGHEAAWATSRLDTEADQACQDLLKSFRDLCAARRSFSFLLPLPGVLPRRGSGEGYQPAARRRDPGKNSNGSTAGAAGGVAAGACGTINAGTEGAAGQHWMEGHAGA